MKVKFVPQNIEIEVTPDKSILQVAHENGIPIRSVCKGVPSCAECRVKVLEGENNLLPPTKAEVNLIGSTYFVDQRRLACQLHCFGDVTVDVSAHVGKDESTSKRLRGVKHTSLPSQTRAVQGTMVLDEGAPALGDDTEETPADRPERQEQQRSGRRPKKRSGGQKTAQQQGPQQKSSEASSDKPKGQKRRRNRNRRPPKPPGSPSKPS